MSSMPNSINDGPVGEEHEVTDQTDGSDHSCSFSHREPDATVDTQSQKSESINTLPERIRVIEKIRALLKKFEHVTNEESGGCHQEEQGKESTEPKREDSVEKQVISTDIDKLNDLLKELKNLDPGESVHDVTDLAFEASSGPPEVIEALIDAGALVYEPGEDGYPLLHHACRYGHTSTVKQIMKQRPPSIEQRTTDWELTPLHIAALYGQKSAAETLLEGSPEINSQDLDGWTPLMAATIEGNLDIMDVLLSHEGIIIDVPDNDGLTPLLVAIKRRLFEGVNKLLGFGADCNYGPDGGEKCLHWAMWRFSRPIFDLLMKRKDLIIDSQDSEGKTALHYACGARHQEMDEQFVLDEAPIETKNSEEPTETETKTEPDSIAIVRVLVKREANPMVATKKNETAVHFALRSTNSNELLRILPIRAEHLGPGDWDEDTLIHIAFKIRKNRKNEESLSYLMNILGNAPNEFDKTLQWAVTSHSRHGFAKYLFLNYYKKDIDEEKASWSAIRWAIYYRRQELLWWLIATSPRNTVMKEQVKAAQRIKETDESNAMKRETLGDSTLKTGKRAKEDSKQQDDEEIWTAIQDILKNPPLAQIYRDTNTLEPPELDIKLGNISSGFESLMVRFYKDKTNSNAIRLSRDVQETIYGTGVTSIMKTETKKLKSILDMGTKGAQLKKLSYKYQTMYDDEKLRFTWVHLPATNDLLKRIMIDDKKTADDFHKVNSFLRDTWFEIPDRESPSRTMRPQFVQRKRSSKDSQLKTSQTKAKSPDTTNESNDKKRSKALEVQSGQTQKQGNNEEQEQPDRHRKPENKQDKEAQEKKADLEEEDFIAVSAVYMPFLSFSTHFQSSTSHNIPNSDEKNDKKNRRSTGKEAKDPEVGKQLEELEFAHEEYHRLIDAYRDAVIHGSATLDEAYYHFASKASHDGKESHDDQDSHDDQERRNKEQIVTKLWERTNNKTAGPNEPWPILRVNQLWIWIINDKKWVNGFVEYLNKQADAGGVQSQPASTEEMMKVMVDYCIGAYERRRQPTEPGYEHHVNTVQQSEDLKHENDHKEVQQSLDVKHKNHGKSEQSSTVSEHRSHDKPDQGEKVSQKHMLSIRQQFSQYINHAGIEETKLFNTFKELVESQQKSTSGINNLRDEILRAHLLFIDVKDIRDELNILKSIAQYQEIVQEKLLGKQHCAELNLPASYVVNDVAEMDKLVERIQSARY
ncbi:unnamed protein product [Clonostachys rosea]|uniref:Ankyrin repeat protein n=1 Tax=Bionectria ochroleuca TaxID=29856 RepID=A0ABY6UGF4_BIOOC|nr:unnamed protein product [Clonostachys rosea]